MATTIINSIKTLFSIYGWGIVPKILRIYILGIPFTYLLAIPVMYIIGMIRAAIGKASVYHNVCLNGAKIGLFKMVQIFNIRQEVLRLTSNEGNILVVHGDKIRHGFVERGLHIGEASLYTKMKLRGHWTLISCYNGCHKDLMAPDLKIDRDPNTNNDYPALIMPLFGRLIVWSGKDTRNYLLATLAVAGIKVDPESI